MMIELKMASRTKANIITFGFKDAVIIATDVFIDENLNTRFRINSPWGTQEISLNVPESTTYQMRWQQSVGDYQWDTEARKIYAIR